MRGARQTDAGRGPETRSRWPVAAGALALLWCAGWYCRGADQGLLVLAGVVAAAAVASPRGLPRTTRWVVWTALAVAVACLAANVARLVPPEHLAGEDRTLDRAVTVCFSFGLTALVFRSGALGVTLVAAAGMPMLTLALARGVDEAGGAAGWVFWVFMGGVALHELAQRLSGPRPAGQAPATAAEAARRLALLALTLALAVAVRPPLESALLGLQRRLFGLVLEASAGAQRRRLDLALGQAVPRGFNRRMRPVLLVEAGGLPGYLRESVFTTYQAGRWLAPKPGMALAPVAEAAGEPGAAYALGPPEAPGAAAQTWRIDVLAPGLLVGFCAPGRASGLLAAGPAPRQDANGALTAATGAALPARYALRVAPSSLLASAYPLPDGGADAAYRAVPAPLAAAASNWVAACAGLAEAAAAREAVARVERHFARGYAYRLGVRFAARPDPLADFMRRREGSCTHFASAAALMFRSRGLPARVVGGYVCGDWNPWLARWVARERDGHAWVEVWDEAERRWLVADPTPPDGHPAGHARPGRLRLALDWALAGWRRVRERLASATPLELLALAGETVFRLAWHALWSPAGAVALAGFAGIAWLRRLRARARRAPQERLREELAAGMRRLERRAAPGRLRRRPHESWEAWRLRAVPGLPEGWRAVADERARAYQELRYRVRLEEAEVRAWLAETRAACRGRRGPRR